MLAEVMKEDQWVEGAGDEEAEKEEKKNQKIWDCGSSLTEHCHIPILEIKLVRLNLKYYIIYTPNVCSKQLVGNINNSEATTPDILPLW